jgi:hypothetical protein
MWRLFSATAVLAGLVFGVQCSSHAQEHSESDSPFNGAASAIRIAAKASRAVHSGDRAPNYRSTNASPRRGGPNFSGWWAGQYVRVQTNCLGAPSPTGFLFRHILRQDGGFASLATSHDGPFQGRSRDKGRRLEFVKRIPVQGGSCNVAVVYKDLAKNGRTTGTGYAVSCSNGCQVGYVANAIRN